MLTWYDGPDPAAMKAMSFAKALRAERPRHGATASAVIDLAGDEAFHDLLTRLPGRVISH